MKNRAEKISFPLAILLSFLLMASPVCAHYDELIEMDIISSLPAFENPDLERLEADKQDRAKIFVQSASLVTCFSSFFLIDQFSRFYSSIHSSPRSTSILRC